MKKRRKRNRKVDPRLTERIFPPGPPRPKVTPQFRARFFAFAASHNLRAFAGQIYHAALANDKLFFKYLAEFLREKPIRFPISEKQRKILQLYFQKPNLSAAEALKELRWPESKEYYRGAKKKALERSKLMQETYRRGWLDSLPR